MDPAVVRQARAVAANASLAGLASAAALDAALAAYLREPRGSFAERLLAAGVIDREGYAWLQESSRPTVWFGDVLPTGEAAPADDTKWFGEVLRPGAPSSAAPGSGGDPLIGLTRGGCRLDRLLGKGGAGRVYEGLHAGLGKRVAVKVLPSVGAGPTAIERFKREGRAAARVNHPNVARVLALGEEAGCWFSIQELVAGESVAARVDREGPLAVDEVVELGLDLADGLAAIHGEGVIHRDLKPQNVVTDADGTAKIVDFGLSRDTRKDSTLTMVGGALGTPLFAPPEQCDVGPEGISSSSDLFGLGATLHFALTGSAPHDDGTGDLLTLLARRTSEPAADVREVRADVPAAFARLLAQLLDLRPSARPDAAATRARLAALATPNAARTSSGRRRLRPRAVAARRSAAPARTATALGVAAGGLVLLVLAVGGGSGAAPGSPAPAARRGAERAAAPSLARARPRAESPAGGERDDAAATDAARAAPTPVAGAEADAAGTWAGEAPRPAADAGADPGSSPAADAGADPTPPASGEVEGRPFRAAGEELGPSPRPGPGGDGAASPRRGAGEVDPVARSDGGGGAVRRPPAEAADASPAPPDVAPAPGAGAERPTILRQAAGRFAAGDLEGARELFERARSEGGDSSDVDALTRRLVGDADEETLLALLLSGEVQAARDDAVGFGFAFAYDFDDEGERADWETTAPSAGEIGAGHYDFLEERARSRRRTGDGWAVRRGALLGHGWSRSAFTCPLDAAHPVRVELVARGPQNALVVISGADRTIVCGPNYYLDELPLTEWAVEMTASGAKRHLLHAYAQAVGVQHEACRRRGPALAVLEEDDFLLLDELSVGPSPRSRRVRFGLELRPTEDGAELRLSVARGRLAPVPLARLAGPIRIGLTTFGAAVRFEEVEVSGALDPAYARGLRAAVRAELDRGS